MGIKTAVMSTALFNDSKSCSGCYQIVCDAIQVHQWCLRGTSITMPPISARQTMLAPMTMADDLAKYRAGIVPILYRKVGCRRDGGIRLTFNSRDHFELFLISNVGGAGEISNVSIKGSKMNEWETISRNWEANWQSLSYLNGQSLSFRLEASNGRTITALNVAPSDWKFGQSFSSSTQF
ncbi:hypothetical protein EUGRSUZ_A00988 [Eucalyptus grandis]|uniref:Uncharacterized protein n=2 Tax=Eucalyptus grandis TaxID=71139 RepID=A0ACC3M3L7_EUCGR|nr:hypothetical protein EUGRSUZ_A00988 [Eucalyptus grandis]